MPPATSYHKQSPSLRLQLPQSCQGNQDQGPFTLTKLPSENSVLAGAPCALQRSALGVCPQCQLMDPDSEAGKLSACESSLGFLGGRRLFLSETRQRGSGCNQAAGHCSWRFRRLWCLPEERVCAGSWSPGVLALQLHARG